MYSNIVVPYNYEYVKLNKNEIEVCIKDIALGKKEALKRLYELTSNQIYGFALSILKNMHEAEDVLHDVYIKIVENAHTYQDNGKPMAWIFTITKNLSLMRLRKTKHHVDINEIIEILPSKCEGDILENRQLVTAAFSYITDEERNILMLHAVAGYKNHEIAKLLDLPLSTVLSKYHRAIKKIKKYMSEEVN